MKVKFAMLMFIVMMLFFAFGCGKGESEGQNEAREENEKGSRDNPYKIGDTVVLNDVKCVSYTSYKDEVFDFEITLEKCITKEEGIEIVEGLGNKSSAVPCAEFTISIDGTYSDSIELNDVLNVASIDVNMQKNPFYLEGLDLKYMQVYTGCEYEYYAFTPCDMFNNFEGEEAKYIVFSYKEASDDAKEKSIYFILE